MSDVDSCERELIRTLRADAGDVKDCYTKFSFQAIAFSSAVLGIIARFQENYPHIALASVASIVLLITVTRIGCYKYSSANRHYGYELHLFRTKNMQGGDGDGWKPYMREIDWEVAMRAWRIVQVTVFGRLYVTRELFPKKLRKKYRDDSEKYFWFDLKKLTAPEKNVLAKFVNRIKDVPQPEYHAGSYLDNMNNVLFVLAVLSTIPLVFMASQLSVSSSSQVTHHPVFDFLMQYGSWVVFLVVFLGIVHALWLDRARRRLLESGLLSIHSCSIMWQAVVVAHYRAIGESEDYRHYTEKLLMQADDLANNIFDIHEWVLSRKKDKGSEQQPPLSGQPTAPKTI